MHVSATHTSPQDRVCGLEGGADGYLVEPVEPEPLLATVRSLLRLWTAEAQLEESAAAARQMAAQYRALGEKLAWDGRGDWRYRWDWLADRTPFPGSLPPAPAADGNGPSVRD